MILRYLRDRLVDQIHTAVTDVGNQQVVIGKQRRHDEGRAHSLELFLARRLLDQILVRLPDRLLDHLDRRALPADSHELRKPVHAKSCRHIAGILTAHAIRDNIQIRQYADRTVADEKHVLVHGSFFTFVRLPDRSHSSPPSAPIPAS